MSASSRALITLTDVLRPHRRPAPTPQRAGDPLAQAVGGPQALLVVAYPRKGETYADLACGFRIGTSTVYRYVREAIGLLAAMARRCPHGWRRRDPGAGAVPTLQHRQRAAGARHLPPADIPTEVPLQLDTGCGVE
jgi:hypothetical protein